LFFLLLLVFLYSSGKPDRQGVSRSSTFQLVPYVPESYL